MNIFQRTRLAFKLAGMLNRSIIGSGLTSSVMRFIAKGQPIWLSIDDISAYIHDYYQRNPDFASVIDYPSEKAALVEWDFYDSSDEETRQKLPDDHELVKLWNCPNPLQGGYEFRKEFYVNYRLFGESFINGVAPKDGENANKWRELWGFPAHIIDLIYGGPTRPVDKWRVTMHQNREVPSEQMLHMKEYNPNYDGTGIHLRGMSKNISLVKAVTASDEAYNAIAAELQAQHPTGYLRLQPGGKDFSKEEIQALQHKINKGKKGKIPFTNQMIDYVMMGGSLVKKDTMDSILSNLRTVARRHGLSSRLFNDPQASTFNNMISDERRAWEDCIKPMVEHSKDEFNAWLCAPWGAYMEPNYKNVAALQKDMKEVADALSKMSFLTVGEKYRLAEITPDNPDDPELEQRQVALVPTGTPLEDDESATAKALGIYGISSNGKKAKTVA